MIDEREERLNFVRANAERWGDIAREQARELEEAYAQITILEARLKASQDTVDALRAQPLTEAAVGDINFPPVVLGLPTRESEALEWFEAAVMLLVKDGLDVRLTGERRRGVNVAGTQRVVGDLDETTWRAECTFAVPEGAVVRGFEARTPEGRLVARDRVATEHFFDGGTYRLAVMLEWRLIPL